jgi:hypothetical protein
VILSSEFIKGLNNIIQIEINNNRTVKMTNFLDIISHDIHSLSLIQNFNQMHDVSETITCLRYQVKLTLWGTIDRSRPEIASETSCFNKKCLIKLRQWIMSKNVLVPDLYKQDVLCAKRFTRHGHLFSTPQI